MALKRPQDMMSAVTKSLKQRTGRDLNEWVSLVQSQSLDQLDQKTVRNWLREEHGVGLNSQWAIADAVARAAGWEEPDLEGYIAAQYTGGKEPLRSIFDALFEIAISCGDDVHAEGRSTYIPLVRQRQFMAIAAATKTRIDLGLRFVDPPKSELLKVAKAPGQATHKLSITSQAEINADVRFLIREAWRQNGS